MELAERITRGGLARDILENAIYLESFELVKQELTTAWETSPAKDTEGRENLYKMLRLLQKLKAVMQTTMETGKLAQTELRYQQTVADKLQRAMRLLQD